MSRRPAGGHDEVAAGIDICRRWPLLQPLAALVWTHVVATARGRSDRRMRDVPNGWAVADSAGTVTLRARPHRTPQQWNAVVAHVLLHYGLGHLDEQDGAPGPDDARGRAVWNLACCVEVDRLARQFGMPELPAEMRLDVDLVGRDLPALIGELRRHPRLGEILRGRRGDLDPDVKRPAYSDRRDWTGAYSRGLRNQVRHALQSAQVARGDEVEQRLPAEIAGARDWIISHYPLLAGMAASFRHVADANACRRMGIPIAAIDTRLREVYCNPFSGLSAREWRFVLAHEYLHAGLRHQQRCADRDPYVWNVACDYVINLWLQEMAVGDMPQDLLLDPSLRGLSGEEIYDRIARDAKKLRRLATFGGRGRPDMLGDAEPWWLRGHGLTLDDWYRHALATALPEHAEHERGLLPAGLVEEIYAQAQPPIPWEVELADWLDGLLPPPETRRSYARASRRQSASPDTPRPGLVAPPDDAPARTFGVVLDTSGSMSRTLLARGLGAISSYAASREVALVRVVFCDAHPFDAGWMSPEEVAGRVRIRGRGGTVLQPGVDLLLTTRDFPAAGPILVITDTACDHVRVRGDHAYLVPAGERLPFAPRGPVFGMAAG